MKIERRNKDWICKDRVHSNLIRLAFVRNLSFYNCLLIFESTLLSVMSCIVHFYISVFYSVDSPSIHFWLKRCWNDDGKLSWKLDSMFGHVIGSSSSAAPAGINRISVRSNEAVCITLHLLLIDYLISYYPFILLHYCLWQNLKSVSTFCSGFCLRHLHNTVLTDFSTWKLFYLWLKIFFLALTCMLNPPSSHSNFNLLTWIYDYCA